MPKSTVPRPTAQPMRCSWCGATATVPNRQWRRKAKHDHGWMIVHKADCIISDGVDVMRGRRGR